MNKLILSMAAAALAIGSVSCSKADNADKDAKASAEMPANATATDSISYLIGKINGSAASQDLRGVPENMREAYRNALIAGVESVLSTEVPDSLMNVYFMGVQMGQDMISNAGPGANRGVVLNQFKATVGLDSINEPELNADARKLNAMMAEKMFETAIAANPQLKVMYDQNVADGKAYIDKVKAADPEVKTTPSGLSYKVVKQGEGAKVGEHGTAAVKYTGKLINGDVFDSSKDQTVDFPVDQVIPGFAEALRMMPAGSKYILYVPENLAYGKLGNQNIAPGSTLEFELEVVSVK